MSRRHWPAAPPRPGGSAHFNVHVSVELRDGRARQPTPQVEPIAILRHHVLHLGEASGSWELAGGPWEAAPTQQRHWPVLSPAQHPQTRDKSNLT